MDASTQRSRRRNRFTLWRRYVTRVWPALGKACRGTALPEERGEILLLKRDNIGDFVLATTFLNVAYQGWAGKSVTLVCAPATAEFASLLYPEWKIRVVGTVPQDEYRRPFWRAGQVRKEVASWPRAGLVVSLRAMRFQEEMIFDSWIPADNKAAIANSFRYHSGRYKLVPDSRVFSEVVPAGEAVSPGLCADIAGQRSLVRRFFPRENAMDAWPSLDFGNHAGALRERLLQKGFGGEDSLMLCPFPSAPIKRYPEQALIELASALAHRHALRIEIMGGPADRAEAQSMAGKLSSPRGVAVSAGELSLVEAAVSLRSARLVLGVDTGLMHMAIASKVPTVVILGGAHQGTFGPWGDPARTRWLTRPMECFHCNWECIHPEPFCITGIARAQIESAADEVLSGAESQERRSSS